MTPSPYSRFFQKGFKDCFDESQKYLNARSSLKSYGSTTVLFLVCSGRYGAGGSRKQLGWRTGELGCITELMSK